MDIHIIIFQNIFEYSQSPWYRVSETPPDFEFRSNFTWENLISVKKNSQIFCKVAKLRYFFYGNLNFLGNFFSKLKIMGCFGNAIIRAS